MELTGHQPNRDCQSRKSYAVSIMMQRPRDDTMVMAEHLPVSVARPTFLLSDDAFPSRSGSSRQELCNLLFPQLGYRPGLEQRSGVDPGA
jgi:hypothetical protein